MIIALAIGRTTHTSKEYVDLFVFTNCPQSALIDWDYRLHHAMTRGGACCSSNNSEIIGKAI